MNMSLTAIRFPRQVLVVSVSAALFSQPTLSETLTGGTPDQADVNTLVVVGQATSGLDNLIDQQELEKTQANSLSDIFRHDPAVNVGGAVSMGQKIYVRDIGEDLLNISVDGAEQAGAVFHHAGRINIEPELLKQVEIEAGAGSATAGPGALGGSVRFTTKDPEDLLKDGQNVGALLKAGYSSNGSGNKFSTTVYGRDSGGILSGMVSLVDSNFDNLEDGNGDEIPGSESDKSLGFVKLVANFDEAHRLSVSYEDLNERGDVLYKPELGNANNNVPEPTKGDRTTTIINYGWNPQDNELIDFSVNLYHTDNKQAREYTGTSYDGGVKSVGTTIENTSLLGNHKLIYGVNYRDDKSTLNDVDTSPYHFEETGEVWGVYVQDVVDVTDQLTVTGGVRFDDYHLEDVNGLEFDDDGVSPNLSANYALNDQWSVSAGYAEAFRGPEVKDAFKLSSASNDSSLKGEESHNTELGLNYDNDNFSLSAGVYKSVIENPIGGTVPWSKVAVNLEDDIKSKGVYLRAEYTMDRLQLGASLKKSKVEAGGETVTRYVYGSGAVSIGDTIQLDASYQFSNTFEAGWNMEYVRSIDDIKLQVGTDTLLTEKPSYTVHDIYARWLPTGNEDFSVSLAVNNLFDEQYLNHASVEDFEDNAGWAGIVGSPDPGRDIRLTLAYSF
ncbi:TonB-dependent receptor domain-containing protein [Aliamphritea spongicola]|uniref:TonB-dependent receptor domain-containing protein n=1 Tax=Aliamphritea spongicola TaxID=707589 RepID=UPI00196ADBC7|nr:TonB-dependent receptor [Aliamphritea spongicola]MBN3562715.1 TonB-dependent receptor [Aliamphritea spongicola]